MVRFLKANIHYLILSSYKLFIKMLYLFFKNKIYNWSLYISVFYSKITDICFWNNGTFRQKTESLLNTKVVLLIKQIIYTNILFSLIMNINDEIYSLGVVIYHQYSEKLAFVSYKFY